MTNILQWNCRGFRANFDELGSLALDMNLGVLCLQETFLKALHPLTLRGFHMFDTYGPLTLDRATGGSSI
jgi:exonuclease III